MEVESKIFGLDTEQSENFREVGSTRMIQLYLPSLGVSNCYYFSKDKFRLYQVDISKAQSFIEDSKDFDLSEVICESDIYYSKDELVSFLSDPNNSFIPHNGLYDWYVLYRDFGVLPKLEGDSYVLASLIPSGTSSRSLDKVCQKWVSKKYKKDRWGSWEDFDFNRDIPTNEQLMYGAYDAYGSYAAERRMRKVHSRYVNEAYFRELALVPILVKSRFIQSSFSIEEVENTKKKLHWEKKSISDSISVQTGEVPKSNSSIKKILFDDRQNKPLILTEKNQPSVSAEALEQLIDPIASSILRMKEIDSMLKVLEGFTNVTTSNGSYLPPSEVRQISAYDFNIRIGSPDYKVLGEVGLVPTIESELGFVEVFVPFLKFRALNKVLTGEWLPEDFIHTLYQKYLNPEYEGHYPITAFTKCIEMVTEGKNVAFLAREFGDSAKAKTIHEQFWEGLPKLAEAITKETRQASNPIRMVSDGYTISAPYVRSFRKQKQPLIVTERISKLASAAMACYQKQIILALGSLPLTLVKVTDNSLQFVITSVVENIVDKVSKLKSDSLDFNVKCTDTIT